MPSVGVIKIGVKRRTNCTDQRSTGFGKVDVCAVNFDNAILCHGADPLDLPGETVGGNAVIGADSGDVDRQVAHQFIDDAAPDAVLVIDRDALFNAAFARLDRTLPAGKGRVVLGIALRQG